MGKRIGILGIVVGMCICMQSCFSNGKRVTKPYQKPLEVIKLSPHNYLHVSYIKTENGHFIPCNGYIYEHKGEALVFDTPLNDSISSQLIDFIQDDMGFTIKGLIVNHHHEDASGGVSAFAKANIPTYAHEQAAALLAKDSIVINHAFTILQEMQLGDQIIENFYPGSAHTDDNIVSYIHSEKLLFGGCMVKALNAEKGNLADADVAAWPTTIATIKERYPEIETVIPGHGSIGDSELLDYTMKLFVAAEE